MHLIAPGCILPRHVDRVQPPAVETMMSRYLVAPDWHGARASLGPEVILFNVRSRLYSHVFEQKRDSSRKWRFTHGDYGPRGTVRCRLLGCCSSIEPEVSSTNGRAPASRL